MRALLSNAPGGPQTLSLEEVPDPVAGAGDLLVRVRAAAINYPDVLIIEDKYQFKPPRPFAPGGEIAGEVEGIDPPARTGGRGRGGGRHGRALSPFPGRGEGQAQRGTTGRPGGVAANRISPA